MYPRVMFSVNGGNAMHKVYQGINASTVLKLSSTQNERYLFTNLRIFPSIPSFVMFTIPSLLHSALAELTEMQKSSLDGI